MDLLPRIKALIDAMHAADPPLWNFASLTDMADRVETWLKAGHSDLTDEAVTALRNWFTYSHK